MQVAIFGAAFDPPHLGHLAVLQAVLNQGLAGSIWLVPAKTHPFSKPLTEPNHRLAMLDLLIADQPAAKIETFELDNPGISYTYLTLTAMSQRYPEHHFSFVMGSDNLARFDEWGGLPVLAQYPFWIYPRSGYPLQPLKSNMQVIQHVPEIDISSTLVRQKLALGESIDQFVPIAVKNYIDDHQLYR